MLKKLKSGSWKSVTATESTNKRKVVLYDDGYNGTTSKRPRLSYQSSRHYRKSRHTDDRKRKYQGHSFSKGSNSISLQDETRSSQIKPTQSSVDLNDKEEVHSIAKEDSQQSIASLQPIIQSPYKNIEPPFIDHKNRRLRRPSIVNKGTQRQILTVQSNVQSTCTIVEPLIANTRQRKLRRPKESPQPIIGAIQPTVQISGSNVESNAIPNEIRRHRRHSKSKESFNLSKTDVKEDSSVKKTQARKQDDGSSSVQVRHTRRISKAREIPQSRTVSVSPNKGSHVRHSMTVENQRLAKTTDAPQQRIVSVTPSGDSGHIGQTQMHSKIVDVPEMRIVSVTTNEGSQVSYSSKVESHRHSKTDVVSVTPSEGSHARQCKSAVNQRQSKAEGLTQSRMVSVTPTDVSSGQIRESQVKAEVASQVRIVTVTPSAGSGGQVRQSQSLGKIGEASQTRVVSLVQKEGSRVRSSLREENPRQARVEDKTQPKIASVTASEVSGGFLRQTQIADDEGRSKSKDVPQPRSISFIPSEASQVRLSRKVDNQSKTECVSNVRTDSDPMKDDSQVCQSHKVEKKTQSEAKDVSQIHIVSVTPGDQKQSKTREVHRSKAVTAEDQRLSKKKENPTPKIVSPITDGGNQALPRTATVPSSDCSQTKDTPQPRTVSVSPNKDRPVRKSIAVPNQNRSKAKEAPSATIIASDGSILRHSPSEENQGPPTTNDEPQLRIVSVPPSGGRQARPLRRTDVELPTVAVNPSDGSQDFQSHKEEQQTQSKMKVASLSSPIAVAARKDSHRRSTDGSTKKRRRHSRTRGSPGRSRHRHRRSRDSKHSSSRRSDSTRASKSDRSRSKTSKSSKRRSHGDGGRRSNGDGDGRRLSHGSRDKIKAPVVSESPRRVVRRPLGPLDLETDYGYVLVVKGDRISLPDWVYL